MSDHAKKPEPVNESATAHPRMGLRAAEWEALAILGELSEGSCECDGDMRGGDWRFTQCLRCRASIVYDELGKDWPADRGNVYYPYQQQPPGASSPPGSDARAAGRRWLASGGPST